MFQIQSSCKNTAQFAQYLPTHQPHPFTIHVSPTKLFSVASTPRTHRSDDSNKVMFCHSSTYQGNTLTRANTQLSGLSQAGLSSRIRTTRIFGPPKLNADFIPENEQVRIKNLKIVNYGPIQVLSHRSPSNYCSNSPQRKASPSPDSMNLKQVTFNRFMQFDAQCQIKGRYHDASQETIVDRSYTQNILPPTEISALNLTILQTVAEQPPKNKQKIKSFNSINKILHEKSLVFGSKPIAQQKIKSNPPGHYGNEVKHEQKQLFWVWVACFVCMGIIMGLLVFT